MVDRRPQQPGQLPEAETVVVKIGSSSLTRADGGLDLNRIDQVARVLAQFSGGNRRVVLVSSGAVAAGRPFLGVNGRPKDIPTAQACAAMGQGILYTHWRTAFQSHYREVAQVLLTLDDVTRRRSYLNVKSALNQLLKAAIIPVVNENDTVATSEIRFGDNDRLAALTAELVGADALVLLTDVEGLYDRPPHFPEAKLIPQVDYPLDGAKLQIAGTSTSLGTGGMLTKITAARQATSAGIPTFVTEASRLDQLLQGQVRGTFFHANRQRLAARPIWLAHVAEVAGEIEVDQGAAKALQGGESSLLAAGVLQVKGAFQAGQVVLVKCQEAPIARGVCAYDATTLTQIAGKRSELISPQHPDQVRPVIHCDDLVQLP